MSQSPKRELPKIRFIGQFAVTVECLPLGIGPGCCMSQPHEALARVEQALAQALRQIGWNRECFLVVHESSIAFSKEETP